MTREEAIKIIESNCSCTDSKLREACAMFIPELAESEDERIRKIIRLALIASEDELSDFYKVHNTSRKECTDWLEKQKEQKPTEWSKVDKNRLEEAIEVVEANGCWVRSDDAVKQVSDFLKSLPERFNLPPKQEWSDEDEKTIDEAVEYIEKYAEYVQGGFSKQYVLGVARRVDSLRPQPHWKPSAEQMGALNYAYCKLFKREDVGHNILGPLQNLIDTLPKL